MNSRVLSYQYAQARRARKLAQELLMQTQRSKGDTVASYKQELEKRNADGVPSLEDVEPGKLVGAVLPMSEKAQIQMRNSIEVIDYLLNQERVVWS